MYLSPFTLPCFFILSGYFTRNYGGNLVDFFYNKVLKAVIVKLIFCTCITTLSVKVIANLILHPTTIPEWGYNILITFLIKPCGNFFSVLVLCTVYFIIVNRICRDKPLPMLLAGIALAAAGFVITRERIFKPWNWDTALVCSFFLHFRLLCKANRASFKSQR